MNPTTRVKLSNEQLAPLVQAYLNNPTPSTSEPVLDVLRPTIDSALASFAQGNPMYATKAKVLALDSLRTWDPSKGANLTTHAYNSLKKLYRVVNDQSQMIHVPEGVKLDWLHVQKYVNDYKDQNEGAEPSRQQIADTLGFTSKRVSKAFLNSSEAPMSSFENDQGESTLGDQGKTPEQLWNDYVYHDLDDKSKVVFEHTVGYNGAPKLPKKEIARKLNISAPAVSQRINTITKRLGEYYS